MRQGPDSESASARPGPYTPRRVGTGGGAGEILRRFFGVTAAALITAAAIAAVAGPVGGAEVVAVPSFFEGSASAAGTSYSQFKTPNPLPVGPGAFFLAESPEATGQLSVSGGEARGAVFYPGALFTGLPSLLCLAGAAPACSVSGFPTVAQAQHPGKPSDRVVTDPAQFKDPASPVHFGAGEGSASAQDATEGGVTSAARFGGWALLPPTAAHAAILDALEATLGRIPGAQLTPDPALVAVGSTRVSQRVAPFGNGAVRAEASAVINDIRMLAGAITVDSVTVTAMTITDGEDVTDATSSTRYSGLFVAGFPATAGPEGITLVGQEGPAVFDGLNGSARAIAEAVQTALTKLRMEIRSGVATATPTPGAPKSGADGLSVTVGHSALTDEAPPQPPSQLCAPINGVIGAFPSEFPKPPPICVVPDATGTDDTYRVLLGRASAALAAQAFLTFDVDLGLDDSFGASVDPLAGDVGAIGPAEPFTALDGVAATPGTGAAAASRSLADGARTGGGTARRTLAAERVALNEALGDLDLWQLYLALAAMSTALALASKPLIRRLSGSSQGGSARP